MTKIVQLYKKNDKCINLSEDFLFKKKKKNLLNSGKKSKQIKINK